jgi:O-antigen ligase
MRAARDKLVALTGWLLCSAPLLVVTVHGWSNGVLFVGTLLSCALLGWVLRDTPGLDPAQRRWALALTLALVAPLAATAIAALLRGQQYWPLYDAPLRFLLAVPVFLFVLRARFDAAAALRWILPLSLALTAASLAVVGSPWLWGPARMHTAVADPLVFGYLSLTFALMCIVAVRPMPGRALLHWRVLVPLLAAAVGIYLSIRSGSRSGWLAIPIVLGIWLHVRLGGHRLAWVGGIAIALAGGLLAYQLLPAFKGRVDLAVQEITQYSFEGVAPINSVGQRITYLRIAADVLAQHPVAGVGDTAHAPPAPVTAFRYALPGTAHTAFRSGFHNQVVTSAVSPAGSRPWRCCWCRSPCTRASCGAAAKSRARTPCWGSPSPSA